MRGLSISRDTEGTGIPSLSSRDIALQTVLASILFISDHQDMVCSDHRNFAVSFINKIAEETSKPQSSLYSTDMAPCSSFKEMGCRSHSTRIKMLRLIQNEVSCELLKNPQHISSWQDQLFSLEPQSAAIVVKELFFADPDSPACTISALLALRLVLSGPGIIKQLTRLQLFSLSQVLASINTKESYLRLLLGPHVVLLEIPIPASNGSEAFPKLRAPISFLCDAIMHNISENPSSVSLLSFIIKQALKARQLNHLDGTLLLEINAILSLAYGQLGLDPGKEY